MTHLGERLTAFIDGELSHAERDRVLVHLAGCDECRAEADALRRVKRRVSGLGDAAPGDRLLHELRAMGEPGGPLPPPVSRLPGHARQARPRAIRPADNRPRRAAVRRRLPRARYLAASAAALAVLGVGSAAFAAGSEPGSLPRVTPSIEQYAVEHALTSGDIPLTDPQPAQTTSEHP
jgi:anti-sigma factor RsiW